MQHFNHLLVNLPLIALRKAVNRLANNIYLNGGKTLNGNVDRLIVSSGITKRIEHDRPLTNLSNKYVKTI
nr:hypothetical protein [Hoylesella enoeca]